jgi:ankyrin repeat protein
MIIPKPKEPVAPLIHAACLNDGASVASLLAQGADVHAVDGWGVGALHWAALHGAGACCALLAGAGAQMDARIPASLDARYFMGRSPAGAACAANDEAILELLLNLGANPHASSPAGLTLAMESALHGAVDCLRLLARHGADLNERDRYGRQALHYSAAKGSEPCLAFLLAQGCAADAPAPAQVGLAGLYFPVQSPLQLAADAGHFDCVQTLCAAGANPSAKRSDGSNPIEHALSSGKPQMAQLLSALRERFELGQASAGASRRHASRI